MLLAAKAMRRRIDQFILLMWKNILIQWRHPTQTLVEIFAPVLLASLMVILRSLLYPELHAASFYIPFENRLPNGPGTKQVIAWAPLNNVLETVVNSAVESINRKNNIASFKHLGFIDSKSLDLYLSNEMYAARILASVEFDDSLNEINQLVPDMNITIRFPAELRYNRFSQKNDDIRNWNTRLMFPLYQVPGPRNSGSNTGGDPNYYEEGFLVLQQELSLAIINQFKQELMREKFNSPVPIFMQRFPYPKYTEDVLLTALQSFVGLIFMLSFVYTCISTVKVITYEKEKQLKESMKIMGLPNWLHWTAWFVKSFIFLSITVILLVILMKTPWYPGTEYTIFTYSNPLIIFLFLMFYISATITFCFAISVFFSKANTAATIAGVVWFLCYFPYTVLYESYRSMTLTHKLLVSLLSNTAMAYGFQLMLAFEGNQEGVQWHNIWQTSSPDDSLTLGHLIIMLVVDTAIYLLIALYVEAIFPGNYGVARPWYFPVTSSYWLGKSNDVGVETDIQDSISNPFYEQEPKHLEAGIKIQQLRKVFSKKVAVRNLTLNMYKGQITALLGHNGAGKTTTMSMLTGMLRPTSGTAIISGHDIVTNMAGVRRSLGLCPQHNILFDELSVKEHLYFYCCLKGLDKIQAQKEAEKYVALLNLMPKADALSVTLSGGMKRKLSVAIALCGDSDVVMLDEPTAGMDPSARRTLWNLLQSQKKGRTILLSTHFMDEADLLGNRIAIMADGELQCCGSSFFLKKKYGAGYHLIMDIIMQCDVNAITALLQKYIPNIEVESNIGTVLSYLLTEEHCVFFEQMLFDLETNFNRLGILSYGISLTTLEEVFMKVGADNVKKEIDDIEKSDCLPQKYNLSNDLELNQGNNVLFNQQIDSCNKSSCETNYEIQGQLLTGCYLWMNQIIAMTIKRCLSLIRAWRLLLIQISIPIIVLSLTILFLRKTGIFDHLPKLKIEMNSYKEPVVVLNHYENNTYSKQYIEMIQNDKQKLLDLGEKNFTLELIDETEKNPATVRLHYICGATFKNDNSIVAWFNNEPLHSAPLALQLVMNAILKRELSSPNYSIQFYNHPRPFSLNTKLNRATGIQNMGFQIAFNIGFSMAFVSAFYLMFYVKERATKVKHLQFLCGVGVLSFWIPSYICDILTFIVTSLCLMLTIVIFQEDGFKTPTEIGRLFSLLLIFGFSMLPMMYLVSYLFDVPSTGFTRITFVNIITGVTVFMIVQILQTPQLELTYIADILHWIFLVVPHYSLSSGVQNINMLYSIHSMCEKVIDACVYPNISELPYLNVPRPWCEKLVCYIRGHCCTMTNNYFDLENPGIGKQLLFSCGTGLVCIIILLLIEYRIFDNIHNKLKNMCTTASISHAKDIDNDVLFENYTVRELTEKEIHNSSLVMKDVTKYYGNFLAVHNICLKVDKFDCFGLLGVNGAGKTTTFKMMTGDIKLSSGDAWINGLNVKSDLKKIYQSIGYCPQFDALLDDLTCRETIKIFGLLRGITRRECQIIAENLAQQFDFYKHLDKQVKELSGGNKRKLSTAIALIGNPSIIYLDEPTTGMDPATKRYLWNALCKIRDNGKCIILTSHSMEECEALCTRLAIMVNGVFKCLGSTQHLKSKFSEGYTLTIKIQKANDDKESSNTEIEAIEKFVKDKFRSVTVREHHEELITFYIADKSQPWSKMFGIMERGKMSLNIEDYSLGQSNLEQVFLTFTKHQRDC